MSQVTQKTQAQQLARQQLAREIVLLQSAVSEKAPDWMIEGQMQTVRTLLAAAECISERAVPQLIAKALGIEKSQVTENLASYQAAADFIFRKQRVQENMDVQPDGYSGPGVLNRGERRPVVSKLTWDK